MLYLQNAEAELTQIFFVDQLVSSNVQKTCFWSLLRFFRFLDFNFLSFKKSIFPPLKKVIFESAKFEILKNQKSKKPRLAPKTLFLIVLGYSLISKKNWVNSA